MNMKFRDLRINFKIILGLLCTGFMLVLLFSGLFTHSRGALAQGSPSSNPIIYDRDANNLYALRSGDGTLLWKHMFGARINSNPIQGAQHVFVAVADGAAYVLRADNGQILSTIQVVDANQGYLLGGVFFDDTTGVLVAATYDCHLVGVDPATSNILWRQNVPDCMTLANGAQTQAPDTSHILNKGQGQKATSGDFLQASKLAQDKSNGILYLSGQGTGLFALRVKDGAILWQRSIDMIFSYQEMREKLYVATAEGIAILDAANGLTLQTLPVPYALELAVSSQALYAIQEEDLPTGTQSNYHLFAYRLSDNHLLWEDQFVAIPGAGLYAAGDALYLPNSTVISSDNQNTEVYAYGMDGKYRWHWEINVAEGIGPVQLIGRYIYFSTFLGAYALDPVTGNVTWHVVWASLASQ